MLQSTRCGKKNNFHISAVEKVVCIYGRQSKHARNVIELMEF